MLQSPPCLLQLSALCSAPWRRAVLLLWLTTLAVLVGGPAPLHGQTSRAEPIVVTATPEKDKPKPGEIVIDTPHLTPGRGQPTQHLPIIRKLVIDKNSRKAVHQVIKGYTPTGSSISPVITYYDGKAYTSGPVEIPVKVLKEPDRTIVLVYLSRTPTVYTLVSSEL